MKIFEYAIILNPTVEAAKIGDTPKLIVKPTPVLAKDPAQAAMLAGREIPDEHQDKIDRLEVAVRPF